VEEQVSRSTPPPAEVLRSTFTKTVTIPIPKHRHQLRIGQDYPSSHRERLEAFDPPALLVRSIASARESRPGSRLGIGYIRYLIPLLPSFFRNSSSDGAWYCLPPGPRHSMSGFATTGLLFKPTLVNALGPGSETSAPDRPCPRVFFSPETCYPSSLRPTAFARLGTPLFLFRGRTATCRRHPYECPFSNLQISPRLIGRGLVASLPSPLRSRGF